MTNFGLVSKVPWYQEAGYSGVQTVIIMFVKRVFHWEPSVYRRLFFVRPAWAQSNGLESRVCPGSGKDIAEHQ
ncbi:MAG: hypothetical protein JXK07_02060, partial [Spirochaetes bacterium]|nr:hypothetical protein [Spirochaetota bacterium]MBN2769928.1 hypothetical protein [Spirochaetota bacterium]